MTQITGVEIRDVGLLDKITRIRSRSVEVVDRVVTRTQRLQQEIPEEIMTALATHLGDAQASITVGAELAHSKEFGCKAQAFVSVSVHCNNKEEDILAVHGVIQPLVQKLVNEDLKIMMVDRDSYLGGPAKLEGKTSNPPAKVVGRPPASQVKPKPGVVAPNLRR